jgi:vacuolar-type H+-ATPase subunit E/Vma4
VIDWSLRKESDQARKAQGKPEKLLKWSEHFYTVHRQDLRERLKPMLDAIAQIEGHELTPIDDVIDAYVQDSQREIRAVAETHDADTLAPALERVLRRWESDRAAAVIDAIRRAA